MKGQTLHTCPLLLLPQVALSDDVITSRKSHSMTAISLAPGLTEVTLFGGSPLYNPKQRGRDIQSIAATAILTFGEFNQLNVIFM